MESFALARNVFVTDYNWLTWKRGRHYSLVTWTDNRTSSYLTGSS